MCFSDKYRIAVLIKTETKVRIICRTIFSSKCFLDSKWTHKGGKNDTNAMPCVIRTRQHFFSFPTPFHRSLMTEKRLLTQVSQLSGTYPSRKESTQLANRLPATTWCDSATMKNLPQEALFPINPLMK